MRDNGVGMTKDEIAFAMQPFHQLDTAPRKQTGTGLGLPVTKALVDANRARLVLTSEPGIGTSADVIFPAERLFSLWPRRMRRSVAAAARRCSSMRSAKSLREQTYSAYRLSCDTCYMSSMICYHICRINT